MIAGYYGFGNVGDEAILSAMLADFRECGGRTLNLLSFQEIQLRPWTTMMSNQCIGRDVDALLNAAKESDLIILGGGGLFQDYWGVPEGTSLTPSHWGISYYSAIGMLAVLFQKPFMLYSVGVGPLLSEEGKQLDSLDLRQFANIVTVRGPGVQRAPDRARQFQEGKIAVLPDPALTLELDSASAAEILRSQGIDAQSRPLLGVCLRNWGEEAKTDQWKRELATTLDQFLATHETQVLFIPFQVQEHTLENDYSVALDIVSMMQNQDRVRVLSESYSPAVTGGIISHCHLILGMRLHSLIFAANAGIPTIALVYDPKVKNFMRSIGLSEYAMDLKFLTVEQFSSVLEDAWTWQKLIQQTLGTRVQKLKNIAKKTPDTALKLLDKRAKAPFSTEAIQTLAIQQTRASADKEQELQVVLAQLETKKHEVLRLKSQIDEILNSRYWKLAQAFRRTRISLIPVGSRRERFAQMFYRDSRTLFDVLARAATSIRQSIRQQGLITALLGWLRIMGIRAYNRVRKNRTLREDLVLMKSSGLFDETWYLNNNPDVAQSNMDPLLHYLYKGGFEGRDPSPQFSSLWYLQRYDDIKKAGINPLYHYLKYGRTEERVISSVQQALTSQVLQPYGNERDPNSYKIVRNVITTLNERSLKGIFVVTSAFVFDEFFNQKVINLSKFLSKQGWGIVYVAWRWSATEAIPSIGEEVYKNIFQVPVDMFLKNIDVCAQIPCSEKFFLVEFPYPGFFLSGLKLQRNGFKMAYEIVDEWEEFHKVGQAIWFNKSLENAFVTNANIVTAVSLPLIEKFSALRQDIHLSPNGYTPALLGEGYRNIACNKEMQKDELHLGYFGHLTESWFDWDFLLNVLNLAREEKFQNLCASHWLR